MIIRVFTEGQYRVPDELRERLNELDREAQAKVDEGDSEGFHTSYEKLLELIRTEGEELADDDLSASDLMLPPPDITLEEARTELTVHGLIPD
jgi:hypothetical protein